MSAQSPDPRRALRGQSLLWLTSTYPADEADGAGRFVADLAQACARRGARCVVVTPARRSAPRSSIRIEAGVVVRRFATPFAAGGRGLVDVEGLPQRIQRAPFSALALLPAYLAAFAAAAQAAENDERCDAVVAQWLVPSGVLAASHPAFQRQRRAGRVVAVAHSSDVSALEKLPANRALARWLSANVRVGATSAWLAERLTKLGVTNVADLRLGCFDALGGAAEAAVADAGAPATSPQSWTPVVLSRLVAGKGLERAVAVAARLPGRRLRVLGDGPLAASLGGLAAGLKVDLQAHGMVTGARKAALLADADVLFFLPGRQDRWGQQDNLPVAVLEALSAGVAVVASAVGALPTAFAPSDALRLVDPDASDGEIAAVVVDLLGAKTSRDHYSDGARALAAPFAMDAAIDRLIAALGGTAAATDAP